MGIFASKERKYGDPLPHKEFVKAADSLMNDNKEAYEALDRCVNHSQINLPVPVRCSKEMGEWNGKVYQAFCNRLYHVAVKCQKAAGDEWDTKCKPEMNEIVACGDDAMRRLYQYNLEHARRPASSA